jgi:DNA-binding transcriptional ArsR family regulator
MPLATRPHFVYHQSMNAQQHDRAVSRIAAAIGDPARSRMLYSLSDGHARTSTELAIIADVSPSTASAHLNRLKAERLVKVHAQGKHRYYSLEGPNVAAVLEGLSVLAGSPRQKFQPNTPERLRFARTCYDHMAGALGVSLHDRLRDLRWLSPGENGNEYDVTAEGVRALARFGIDVAAVRTLRRRFACPCLDWSERRPHLAGSLGAALLEVALRKKWLVQDLDSRALRLTKIGQREMQARFGLNFKKANTL